MDHPVLVFLHAPWETPGLIEGALGESVPTIRRTILDQDAPDLPPPSEVSGLVVMGGPQDASDDQRHPGLRAERRFLAEAVSADVPVLGVCLGMQLLALSLGAKLHLRHGNEIGFAPVDLTERGSTDPALAPFRDAFGLRPTFLHWHSDAVDLPHGAELLASTPITPVQAFRMGPALGTQFHPEADARLLEAWLATPAMAGGIAPAQIARIRREGAALLPRLRTAALNGLSAFALDVKRRRER